MKKIPEQSKVSPNDIIKRIIQCINAGQTDKVYSMVEQYSETLSQGGKHYYGIRNAIKARPQIKQLRELNASAKRLITEPALTDSHIFLPDCIGKVINEIMLEYKHREILQSHKIDCISKILLHGPTGNGKTTIARHFASLMQLPLIEIESEKMVTCKVGESGANIREVFSSIKEPCVLFWDEVDTIGVRRSIDDTTSAGHENDRMVNAMLTSMEKLSSEVFFIGATNRRNSLDTAFARRFDLVLEVPAPDNTAKIEYLNSLVKYHSLPKGTLSSEEREAIYKLPSFSEIKNKVIRIAKNNIIKQISGTENLSSGNNEPESMPVFIQLLDSLDLLPLFPGDSVR